MKIGCCGEAKDVYLFSQAGFDYLEPSVVDLLETEKVHLLAKNTQRYELPPEVFNRFLPAHLPIVGSEVDEDTIKNYLKKVLPLVASLGGQVIVFGSGGARKIPAGFPPEIAIEQVIQFLKLAAEIAGDKVKIVIEPLRQKQSNMLNLVKEAREVCEQLNWDVGLLADLFHMTHEKEPLSNLEPVLQLTHVHIPFPEDVYEVEPFIRVLKTGGYEGRICLEDNGGYLGSAPEGELEFLLSNAANEIKRITSG